MFSRLFKFLLSALLALPLFMLMAAPAAMQAQEPSKPPSGASAQHESATDPAKAAGEVVKEKEPEEKGEQDWYRKSPSVLWLAKKTGMPPAAAFWVSFGLNFAIIFFLIARLMKKTLPGYFGGRTSVIQKGIEDARKMSEEARRRLGEVEGRLSRLDTEIAAMRSEADENAKAEERRIQEAGEEERRRIVSSAQEEIDLAASTARRELRTYAAELAVELAEKKIRVDKKTDEALVREFTSRLGKDGN